jgi:hypothetical protein
MLQAIDIGEILPGPIDLANPSKVIASKVKQHVIASEAEQSDSKHHDPLRRIRLLRRRLAMTGYRNIFLTTTISAVGDDGHP